MRLLIYLHYHLDNRTLVGLYVKFMGVFITILKGIRKPVLFAKYITDLGFCGTNLVYKIYYRFWLPWKSDARTNKNNPLGNNHLLFQ